MGFDVQYEELTDAYESMLNQLKEWEEDLGNLKGKIQVLICMQAFRGAAATQVKSYLREVHVTLIDWLINTIETYRCNLSTYLVWYYSIESDMCAHYPQAVMEELEARLYQNQAEFQQAADNIRQIEAELSAYMLTTEFYSRDVEEQFLGAEGVVRTRKEEIGEYEESHKNGDFAVTGEMLSNIRSLIQGRRKSRASITSYRPGSIQETESYQQAARYNEFQEYYISCVKEQAEASEEYFHARQEAWEEEVRKRRELEIINMIEGLGAMLAGGVLIIASCGTATPLVVSVCAVTIGGGAMVYGASNSQEAQENLKKALNGDARGMAGNYIRDTYFASNPQMYYTIGNACVMASVIATPAFGAIKGGVSITGTTCKELVKMGVIGEVSQVTGDIVSERTGSQLMGRLAGDVVAGGMNRSAGSIHGIRSGKKSGTSIERLNQPEKAGAGKVSGVQSESRVKGVIEKETWRTKQVSDGKIGGESGTVADFYVGPNGKSLPSQYKDWIGKNIQTELLDQAENPQLQNAIKQLYRGNSFIGDGGTADVIRFEKQTGLMLGKNGGSHVQKGIDIAKYIENKILTQDLSPSDRALAAQLLEDLYNELGR